MTRMSTAPVQELTGLGWPEPDVSRETRRAQAPPADRDPLTGLGWPA